MCENPKVFIQPEPEFPALTSSVYMSTRPPSVPLCARGVHGSLGFSLGVACACYFSKSPNYDGIITSTRVGNDNYLPLQKASKFPPSSVPCLPGWLGRERQRVIFLNNFLFFLLNSPLMSIFYDICFKFHQFQI